jgi:hypothetical protein
MSGHTPGPWWVRGWAGQHEEHGAQIVGPTGKQVASSWGGLYEAAPQSEWDRYHADAYLIAAAPELLAALRYTVDNADFDSEEFNRLALNAIAKAEGKA